MNGTNYEVPNCGATANNSNINDNDDDDDDNKFLLNFGSFSSRKDIQNACNVELQGGILGRNFQNPLGILVRIS